MDDISLGHDSLLFENGQRYEDFRIYVLNCQAADIAPLFNLPPYVPHQSRSKKSGGVFVHNALKDLAVFREDFDEFEADTVEIGLNIVAFAPF